MAEISLLHVNGGLNKLFVPMGEERKGWIAFFTLIINYPLLSTKIPDHQPNSRSQSRRQDHRHFHRPTQPLIVTKKSPQMSESWKRDAETYLSILNKKGKTTNNELSLSPIRTVWDTVMIATWKHFYDDWFMINRSIQSMLNDFCQLNPYKVDKVILRCTINEHVSLICNKKDCKKLEITPWK